MTIIFCFYKIFRNSHRQIFELDKLVQEGNEIILLDLLTLHGKEITADDDFMLKHRKVINSMTELYDFKAGLPDSPVIFVTNDSYLQKLSGIFKIIKRNQDRLISFRIKATIFAYKEDSGLRFWLKKFIEKTKLFPWHKLKVFYDLNHNYYAPDYLMCSTNYYLPLKAYLTVKRKNILVIHSDDVNRIVTDKSEIEHEQKIGVFLDQVLPFAYQGMIDHDKYYENVENTLKKLEKYFNLHKIIISEHPESEAIKDELKGRYQNFERSRRNSQKLIRNADVVFAHYSTSIGMAVYYKKPVVLLIDDHLREITHIENAIGTYEKNLHFPVVDMGENDFSILKDRKIHDFSYSNFIRKYMRDNYSVDENSYHYAIKKAASDLIYNQN
ncbi:hypothetical protein [Salinimicrobium sp. GXAS 041]|uniref:hypothetical protein n=1 Tax=Salinimicrobium sp. GXAS 041 TaxID=3400806 RepID=UPI003C723331